MDSSPLLPELVGVVATITPSGGAADADGGILGRAVFAGGQTYQGRFLRGMMDGTGAYTWEDGTTFVGTFDRNKINGRGTFTWPNASTYEGDVRGGLRHGGGTMTTADGTTYAGAWSGGLRHGRGTMCYVAGAGSDRGRYDGDWCENQREGQGAMTYASGNVYAGGWAGDVKCGAGTMCWLDRGEEYVGGWAGGVQNGFGEHSWTEAGDGARRGAPPRALCNRYCGEWRNGLRHGTGTFYYANGASYTGGWEGGLKAGKGVFVHENGAFHAGEFLDDHVVGPSAAPQGAGDAVAQAAAHMALGDLLPGASAADAEQAKVRNVVLRHNSDLRAMYQSLTLKPNAAFAARGICAASAAQLLDVCEKARLVSEKGPLTAASVHLSLLAMRRQHATAIDRALFASAHGDEAYAAPLYTTAQDAEAPTVSGANLDVDAADRPLLYREFIEALVRVIFSAAAVTLRPDVSPAEAVRELLPGVIASSKRTDEAPAEAPQDTLYDALAAAAQQPHTCDRRWRVVNNPRLRLDRRKRAA